MNKNNIRVVVAVLMLCQCLAALAQTTAALAVETVQRETMSIEQVLDGVLEAVNQSTVSAQVSGRVAELPFDINDFVNKGEVIVRFHAVERQASVNAAKGRLAEAKARYAEAETEFKRIDDIYKKGLLSKADLDRARANLDVARAKRASAEAALQQVEEQLEQTVVRAPYSGIVVGRHVEIGELATVGKSLMTGISLEHLRVVVNVPQRFINQVRQYKQAVVITPDQQRLNAESLRIFPYADEKAHTFRVRVQLPPGQHNLYPGMLVKVAFMIGEQQQLTVPEQAVVRRSEITGVYVQDSEQQIHFRLIRIGKTNASGNRIVLAGLTAGEQIILNPIAAAIALKQQATQR